LENADKRNSVLIYFNFYWYFDVVILNSMQIHNVIHDIL